MPVPPVSWSDVARVCRRVCVLRERGQAEEAEQLRGSLAEMLSAVRTPDDTDATLAGRLETVFAQEGERVANAAVLAELLAPMLSEQQRSTAPAPIMAPAMPVPAPLPPPPSKPPVRRAPSIADFIDEMIAQESPVDRSGAAARKS